MTGSTQPAAVTSRCSGQFSSAKYDKTVRNSSRPRDEGPAPFPLHKSPLQVLQIPEDVPARRGRQPRRAHLTAAPTGPSPPAPLPPGRSRCSAPSRSCSAPSRSHPAAPAAADRGRRLQALKRLRSGKPRLVLLLLRCRLA